MHRLLPIILGLCAPAHAGEGPLDGLVVYLSAGHGYVVHPRGEGWQRPVEHGLLEDTWTARFATRELIPALERLGATVLTARERDPHRERVVVDDADPGFVGEGTAADGHTLLAGEGRFELTAPHAGTWQLYARWQADPAHSTAATYTVRTPTEHSLHTVDQTAHGGEWWPLERLELQAGDTVEVALSGEGAVSADAVRLGGGSYLLETSAGPRAVRAWEAAARHHLELEGVPESVWGVPGGGLGGDASARARWADWSHPPGEEAVYLSVHTDAGGGTGTTAFVRRRCTGCDERSVASTRLADAIRGELVAAVRAEHDPEWSDRGTRGASLAEVSDELNPEIPSALLELGFHDHADDARLLADREAQATLAEAIARGLAAWRSPASEPPPGPVAEVRWADESLTWQESESHGSGEASKWRVRGQDEGGRWRVLTETAEPTLNIGKEVVQVEITAIGPGGMGRPVRVERAESAVAEGGT